MNRLKAISSWIFLGWFVLSVLWIALTNSNCSTYYPDYTTIINYPDLLYLHSDSIWKPDSPFLALSVTLITGIILVLGTGRRQLGLLLLPVGVCGCFWTFLLAYCDGTTLHHVDTVEFDSKIYHLTVGDDRVGGDVFSQILFLHECDTNRNYCRGRQIAQEFWGNFKPLSLKTDEMSNQLRVMQGETIFFVLDADVVSIPVPQSLEPIASKNANQIEHLFQMHYDSVIDLVWSYDGTWLASGSEAAVWLHRFDGKRILTNTPLTNRNTTNIVFSPDRPVLAVTSGSHGTIRLWNVDTPDEPEILPVHFSGGIAFSSDGRFLAFGSYDDIMLLDAQEFTPVTTINVQQAHSIKALSFSPDGLLLAVSGSIRRDHYDGGHGFVQVWDWQNEVEVFFFRTPFSDTPEEVVFSPDSSQIAFATTRAMILTPDDFETHLQVWDLRENSEHFSTVVSPTGQVYRIYDLVWTPDGEVIISVGSSTIHFWDANTGEMLAEREGHSFSRGVLALNPDGTLLASGGDSAVHFWGILSEE